MRLWRRIWEFFNPKDIVIDQPKIFGNCEVKLTRGWRGAEMLKMNFHTCWVQLRDGNVIKRRRKQVRV
jgi:hypothetical protein